MKGAREERGSDGCFPNGLCKTQRGGERRGGQGIVRGGKGIEVTQWG